MQDRGLRLSRKNLTLSAQVRTTQKTKVTETSFSLLICFPHPPLSRASQSQTDLRSSPSAILSCARNWHHECSFHSLCFTIQSPFLNVCCIIFLLLSVHFPVKFQDCCVHVFIQPKSKHSSLYLPLISHTLLLLFLSFSLLYPSSFHFLIITSIVLTIVKCGL